MATSPTPPHPPPRQAEPRIDPHRYRRVRRFIVRVFLHALWWDVLLSRPLLSWARRDPTERWRAIARRYRALAIEMGGVLIKLGQFLSIRVDLLPPEVTAELAGLQDRVPPEPAEAILAAVEADFRLPLGRVFSHFDPVPVGSASLAQAHHARLPGGEEVVVKVLRPGIDVLVETDLAAIALATRWLKLSRQVRRRVDLDRLTEEFQSTTRRELDLAAEAVSAERFAELFADDETVRVPRIHREASAARTLTLEDVGHVRIADHAGLAAAGIDRGAVARKLYDAYMRQIFDLNLVHADPHPGNLFVEPLPTAAERAAGVAAFRPGEIPGPPPPGDTETGEGRPFRIVFVDFGMVATIPTRLRGALRDYLIGFGSRDAARIVQSYVRAGVLLPGADVKRLEELHETLFARFWGLSVGELRDVAMNEAASLFREYRDLLWDMPFQVPVDLLFTNRAIGLVAGVTTSLDPGFDPWTQTLPFAEELAAEEAKSDVGEILAELGRQAAVLVSLPSDVKDLLARTERGSLTVQASLAPEARSAIDRLERTGRRFTWILMSAAFLLAGVGFHTDQPGPAGYAFFGLAAATFLWGMLRHR